MANYTGRKHPKLDHMSEKDRLGSEIVVERAALGEIVGRLTRDAVELGEVGEGSLESDIGQLTENFEYIVSELESASQRFY